MCEKCFVRTKTIPNEVNFLLWEKFTSNSTSSYFFVNFQKILMVRAEKSRIFIWILFLNRDGNDEMNRNYNITIECEKFLEGVTQPSIEKGVQIVLRLVEVIFLARIVNLYEAEVCLEGIMPEEGLGIKTNYTCRMIISVLQVSSPCFCARFSLFRALCLERNLLYSIIFYYFLEKMLWGYLVGSSEYQQIAFFFCKIGRRRKMICMKKLFKLVWIFEKH